MKFLFFSFLGIHQIMTLHTLAQHQICSPMLHTHALILNCAHCHKCLYLLEYPRSVTCTFAHALSLRLAQTIQRVKHSCHSYMYLHRNVRCYYSISATCLKSLLSSQGENAFATYERSDVCPCMFYVN